MKQFHKCEREKMLPNSFYYDSITLIQKPKPDKDTYIHTHTHKENYRLISLMNIDTKILSKILTN
jgi:hypothetical protein